MWYLVRIYFAHAQLDPAVSIAIKMAANFAEAWRTCAFEEGDYAKSAVFSSVLAVLDNKRRLAFSPRVHGEH